MLGGGFLSSFAPIQAQEILDAAHADARAILDEATTMREEARARATETRRLEEEAEQNLEDVLGMAHDTVMDTSANCPARGRDGVGRGQEGACSRRDQPCGCRCLVCKGGGDLPGADSRR